MGTQALHYMINLELSLYVAGSFKGDFCDPSVQVPISQLAQQSDGDIYLVITVKDGATGLPVDVSAATAMGIRYKKPDLTAAVGVGAFSTNGMDGKIQIPLGPADLAQSGWYFAQANFTIASVAKSSLVGSFEVLPNIIIPVVTP